MSLHALSTELTRLHERSGNRGFTLGEMLNMIGDRGFGVFLTFLAVPSAMPVPAPGYSTPFGILLVLLGLQMIFQRSCPWIPRKMRQFRISRERSEKLLSGLAWILGKMERWIRPRHLWMLRNFCFSAIGGLVVLMGGLMIFPIPLTNTAPAFIILLLGIGLTEQDGLITGAAAALGIILALFYLAALIAILHFGLHGMEEVREILRGWFH